MSFISPKEIDFELASPSSPTEPLSSHMVAPLATNENSSPSRQAQQINQQTSQSGSGLMSSLKGGAGSFMKNIRDKSQSVIQTVQHSMATKGIYVRLIEVNS